MWISTNPKKKKIIHLLVQKRGSIQQINKIKREKKIIDKGDKQQGHTVYFSFNAFNIIIFCRMHFWLLILIFALSAWNYIMVMRVVYWNCRRRRRRRQA